MDSFNNGSFLRGQPSNSVSELGFHSNVSEEEDYSYINNWHHLTEETKDEHIKSIQEKADNLMGSLLHVLYSQGQDHAFKMLDVIENEVVEFLEKRGIREVYLMLKLASFCSLVGKKEDSKKWIDQCRKILDCIDQCKESADCERIISLLTAKLLLSAGEHHLSLRELKSCWDVPQKYFPSGKEDFLDFYSAIRGRISFMKKKFDEAEEFYLDALTLRLKLNHNRLRSLSYVDLAELYVERAKNQPSLKNKAEEYLKKGKEAYDKFLERCGRNDDVNVGIVDYSVPDFEKVQKELDKIA